MNSAYNWIINKVLLHIYICIKLTAEVEVPIFLLISYKFKKYILTNLINKNLFYINTY